MSKVWLITGSGNGLGRDGCPYTNETPETPTN
jgi:hypothetical protein